MGHSYQNRIFILINAVLASMRPPCLRAALLQLSDVSNSYCILLLEFWCLGSLLILPEFSLCLGLWLFLFTILLCDRIMCRLTAMAAPEPVLTFVHEDAL